MDPANDINPYEAPKQKVKSRMPLYVAAGVIMIALTGSAISFVAYRAYNEAMRNLSLDRGPVPHMDRGPLRDWQPPPDLQPATVDTQSQEVAVP